MNKVKAIGNFISSYASSIAIFAMLIGVGSIVYNKVNKTPPVPYCQESQMEFGDWGICKDGLQDRLIKNLFQCRVAEDISTSRPCLDSKKVYIFKKGIKEYSTKVKPSIQYPYSENNGNLTIRPVGKFKGATLTVKVTTTVKDGSVIKIPEFYYVFFSLNELTPRILGTSRKTAAEIDSNDYGVFQGTETPKTVTFDLTKLKLAKPSGEIGADLQNYVQTTLNEYSGKDLTMSLYVADGRSMTEPDQLKRIFATITDAYIEYTCLEGVNCSLERIPELPIEKY